MGGGDVAVGAGAVLDHHRLAEALRERLAEGPRELVGGTARGLRHDQHDGLVRVAALRERGTCEREAAERDGGGQRGRGESEHGKGLLWVR